MMFFTYLRRELTKRFKQSLLVASGLAIAIALVVSVNAVSAGIHTAQDKVLSSMYGIGTDISVTKAADITGGFGQKFNIGPDANGANGKSQAFNLARLRVSPGSALLTEAEVAKISKIQGVGQASATLKLTSITFSGKLPTFTQNEAGTGQPGQIGQGGAQNPMDTSGGSFQRGPSSFGIDTFSVEGISTATSSVGPLTSTKLSAGRLLTDSDAGENFAVLDAGYAKTAKLAVNDTLKISTSEFKIIGLVSSSSSQASTGSNVYIPLGVAQKLSSNVKNVTNIYVSATSADQIPAVKASITKALPGATVNTSEDLASTVSGSLATASSLIGNLGVWLSIIVLLVAFATSILFTTSGVTRRTREFGTLKAIGWRSGRIVRQVLGESLVTGLLGGILGIALGLGGVWAINSAAPSLSASLSQPNSLASRFGGGGAPGGFPPAGGGFGSGGGGFGRQAEAAVNVTLSASVSIQMILIAIAFALVGGLLAGAFGGLRAAKLSPSEALRSVA
jgi:putative ABC transport system permease protein